MLQFQSFFISRYMCRWSLDIFEYVCFTTMSRNKNFSGIDYFYYCICKICQDLKH